MNFKVHQESLQSHLFKDYNVASITQNGFDEKIEKESVSITQLKLSRLLVMLLNDDVRTSPDEIL